MKISIAFGLLAVILIIVVSAIITFLPHSQNNPVILTYWNKAAYLWINYPPSWNFTNSTATSVILYPSTTKCAHTPSALATCYGIATINIAAIPANNSTAVAAYEYIRHQIQNGSLTYSKVSTTNTTFSGYNAFKVTLVYNTSGESVFYFINATQNIPYYYDINYGAKNQSNFTTYLPEMQQIIGSVIIGYRNRLLA